jgi:hypothetical protein
LIARALFMVGRFIDAHGNIGRLLADSVQHRAALAVKADIAAVVAYFANDFSDQGFGIDPGVRGNFTGQNDHAGFDHGFTSDP